MHLRGGERDSVVLGMFVVHISSHFPNERDRMLVSHTMRVAAEGFRRWTKDGYGIQLERGTEQSSGGERDADNEN